MPTKKKKKNPSWSKPVGANNIGAENTNARSENRILIFSEKICAKHVESMGPLAFAFCLVVLCQAVSQQYPLPRVKPYNWVLADFLWSNTRT